MTDEGDLGQGRALRLRDGADYLRRRLALRRHHRRAAGDDDPGLLAGDLGHGVAEDLAVLQADVGDDRALLLVEDVRRVEQAAEPDLDNLRLHLVPAEEEEPERRQRVEGDELAPGKALLDSLDRRR